MEEDNDDDDEEKIQNLLKGRWEDDIRTY